MLRLLQRFILVIAVFFAMFPLAACGARVAGNESSAITNLRMIIVAQMTYSSSCAGGGFATTLRRSGQAVAA